MTAETSSAKANYVQRVTEAALLKGGPLYRELSDLVGEAMGEAMRAAGIEGDDPGAVWPGSFEPIEEAIAHLIAEEAFKEALNYFQEADAEPGKPQLIPA
jgi:hypothetical protein